MSKQRRKFLNRYQNQNMEPELAVISVEEYLDLFGESDNEEEFLGFEDDEPESDIEFDVSEALESGKDGSHIDDETDEGEDGIDIAQNWTTTLKPVHIDEFSEQTGPTFQLNEEETRELDIFERIFGAELLFYVVQETNRNAHAKLRHVEQRLQLWEDVTVPELRAYFCVVIVMGITNLPEMAMYWSSDPFYGNEGIKKVFTRARFKDIGRFLHFSDSSKEPKKGEPQYDRLYKLRHVLEFLKKKFPELYNPGKNLSVDEGMISHKGRISFKQYMPAKPTKYGIKAWLCADSENGYVNNFEIYLGKDKDGEADTAKGLGHYVVMNMTKPYHGKFHHVYFDNFFNSPALMEDLLKEKTLACGTVRTNRKGLPKALKRRMEKGEIITKQKGQTSLVMTTWKDKREINMLSTNCSPDEPPKRISRRSKDGGEGEIEKPAVVCNYNENIGGVDSSDQMLSYYSLGRKSHRWYKCIF